MLRVFRGDSLRVLKKLKENSIDAVVTDPPYGLSFMGKKWDYDVPTTELWAEVFRVLKPGGHLLAFFGTRTYHRGVVRIEDAGFEIRDQVMWIYGSGFPKSLDVSKAIDKAAGAEREVIGLSRDKRYSGDAVTAGASIGGQQGGHNHKSIFNITAPATDDAKRWQGFGTALKPANEPIVLARKPLEKGLTVAENVLKYGTGAINVDGCRIGHASEADKKNNTEALARFNSTPGDSGAFMASKSIKPNLTGTTQGRWPANVIFDEESAALLDLQSGQFKGSIGRANRKSAGEYNASNYKVGVVTETEIKDFGGASRFFYVAKASKRERGADNRHPTVKPIKLMEYLCKLITPPSGVILDPFMGSGSTGVAAKKLKFNFIGVELNDEYYQISKNRIKNYDASRSL